MRAGGIQGIVRVTRSRDDVEAATKLAWEKKREGYSAEALVLAVDEHLGDISLSRAIVLYIQSNREGEADIERPFSWFSIVMALLMAAICLWLVVLLFRLVNPLSSFIDVLLVVIGQAILLRLALRGVRLALMSACDGLNDSSFPTSIHPMRNAPSVVSTIRLKRLRALVKDSADRVDAGESPGAIERDLAQLNLTPRAARFLVWLARVSAATRDYFPPYGNVWMGYGLAAAFVITCIVFLERSRGNLADGYRNYAIGVTGWIAGDIAARPRKRPQSPTT